MADVISNGNRGFRKEKDSGFSIHAEDVKFGYAFLTNKGETI